MRKFLGSGCFPRHLPAFTAALLLALSGGCRAARPFAGPESLTAPAFGAASQPSSKSAGETGNAAVVLDFAGDCALSDINDEGDPLNFPEVYRRSGSYTYPFDRVKSFFASDDLTVVNFECALTSAVKTGDKQWHFRGDAAYAGILPASSVEAAVVANNHCPLDYLAAGYRDTVRSLAAAWVGVAAESQPLIRTVHGVQVVVIADCSIAGENTTRTAGVAERVTRQIRQYKRPDNLVVVEMHWGEEYRAVPQPWQQAAARQFLDAGADLVVGQHPHVLSGIELYRGRPIVYSLGNFAFGGNRSCPDARTCVFRAVFVSEGGRVRLRDWGVLPCLASSSTDRSTSGLPRNNFQPVPAAGQQARQVTDWILQQSRALPVGIKTLRVYSAGN